MSLIRRFILLGLSSLLGTAIALPQWIQSNSGLTNLNVQTVAFSNSVIIVGTERGIYRSMDSGDSWSCIGLDTSAIIDIAVEGERIFVLANSGMYLSNLSGASWKKIDTTGWPASTMITSIAMRGPFLWTGAVHFAQTERVPIIFTTTDSGSTWSTQSTPLKFLNGGDFRELDPIVVSGSDLYASLKSKGLLYHSTDDGKNWTETTRVPHLTVGYSNTFPDIAAEDSTIVLPVNNYYEMSVFRSTNRGLDWVETRTGLPRGQSTGATWAYIAMHGSDIYITSDSARVERVYPPTVYRSTNSGASWIDIGSGLGHDNISGIVLDSHSVYVGTKGGGVYRHPFNTEGSLNITIYQEDPFGLLGPTGRVRLFKDTVLLGEKRADANSVVEFNRLPAGRYLFEVYNDRITPWGEQFWGRGGVNVAAGAVTYVNHPRVTPFMPDTRIYIDSTNELLPFGSFREIAAGTRLRVEVDIIRPPDGDGETVFCYSNIILDRNGTGPYDYQHSSSDAPFRPGEKRITKHYPVLLEPGSYSLSCAAAAIHFGLTDGGGWLDPAFTVVRTPLVPVPSRVELSAPASGSNTTANPVTFVWQKASPEVTGYWFEIATDSGFAFTMHDSTLTDTVHVRNLANGTYWWKVRARNGTGWGTFSESRTLRVTVTGLHETRALPADFVLYQNYPSPFNPSTTIRYGLPHTTRVLLTVWDVLGQQISTLYDGQQEAGYHEIQFDARDLPSGVYLYRINAGDFGAVKKLLLLR